MNQVAPWNRTIYSFWTRFGSYPRSMSKKGPIQNQVDDTPKNMIYFNPTYSEENAYETTRKENNEEFEDANHIVFLPSESEVVLFQPTSPLRTII